MQFLKKIKYLIFLIFLLGCNDDNTTPNNFVSFELDGVAWEGRAISAQVNDIGLFFQVIIVAENEAGERLTLNINSNNQRSVGTYQIDINNNRLTFEDTNNTTFSSNACVTGSITIQELSENSISGNFNGNVCNGNQTKRITNGNFIQVLIF